MTTTVGPDLKILIVGTFPPPMGGTTVSLQQLITSLSARANIDMRVVKTNDIRGNKFSGLSNFFAVQKDIARGARHADVVALHVGLKALPIIGPFAWCISRCCRKPFIVRRFGGVDHHNLKGLSYLLADWVIKHSDIYLVQTKELFHSAREKGIGHAEWFPTSRPGTNEQTLSRPSSGACKRFVFISHVKLSKGVLQLVEAARRFGDDVTVNVYGPFYDGLDESIFTDCEGLSYRGLLTPNEVPEVLRDHDALLLPTFYPGEGYPGIILEAFSAGLPVITTQWKAIPEIVDESCGILIPPRDSNALYLAMSELVRHPDLYNRLRDGALMRHKRFDSEVWTETFINFCERLTRPHLIT